MKKQFIKIALCILLSFGFFHPVLGQETPQILVQEGWEKLQGLGIVSLKNRNISMEVDQVIRVQNSQTLFWALDDFGGTAFMVSFEGDQMTVATNEQRVETGQKKLKYLLSLPLKKDQFINALTYRDFDCPLGPVATTCEKQGFKRLEKTQKEEVWHAVGKKKLTLIFADFVTVENGKFFPRSIKIDYKKNYFHLKWKKLETK